MNSPPFFLRDRRASETRARVKITPREKFLAWGDFHSRSRFPRSIIPEEKWGTTRSLYEYWLPGNEKDITSVIDTRVYDSPDQ